MHRPKDYQELIHFLLPLPEAREKFACPAPFFKTGKKGWRDFGPSATRQKPGIEVSGQCGKKGVPLYGQQREAS